MAKGNKENVHKLLYGFLSQRAQDATRFTFDDIRKVVTTWNVADTWETYVSKKLKPYVEREGDHYRVKKAFIKVTLPQFGELFTQKSDPVPTWARATYEHVVSYEFLMPLTREDKLRAALDEVFFRDTIDERTSMFNETERAELKSVMPPEKDEDDDIYRTRVANQLADIIGGYSITHVAGRFRAGSVVSRRAAAEKLVEKTPYLIDETTAVVRFIMPCPNSRREHGERFIHRTTESNSLLQADIDLIRTLFFLYFAEAIAATIMGEQLIWLIERSPDGERIYAWEKTSDARRIKPSPNAASQSPVVSPSASSSSSQNADSTDARAAAPTVTRKGSAADRKTKREPASSDNVPASSPPTVERLAPATAELRGSMRHWLRTNGYDDVADMIDEVMAEWQKADKTTRRNWWDVLAGDSRGRPCKVAGREFPILVSAQRRQKRQITENAIQRSPSEPLPD